jgi:predicted dehydrogenase
MVEFSFEIGVVGSGMITKFHAKAIKAIAGTRLVAT